MLTFLEHLVLDSILGAIYSSPQSYKNHLGAGMEQILSHIVRVQIPALMLMS